jgi:SAM-dependent methyltransferase
LSAFWHPLSTVYLREPWSIVSPAVLRLLLQSDGAVECVYAGDRMWPALRHGQEIRVLPQGAGGPHPGDLVLVQDQQMVDVLRVTGEAGALRGACDADPSPPEPIDPARVLGMVAPAARRLPVPRGLVRLWLDLMEAATAGADVDDPAETVRGKYDHQAIHYAQVEGDPLDPDLRATLETRLCRGARVLVAGSGTGREALAVEALGFEVSGVDFSPRMVEAARRAAAVRGSAATFDVADLREHDEAAGSLDAVLFTYDVYSFVPRSAERVRLLMRMARWLRPGGCVFLSARRVRGRRAAAVLTVQRWRRGWGISEWGDSHTRWLDGSGRLRRSFIRVFTGGQLETEASRAGFRAGAWRVGHGVLERLGTAA